MERRLYLLLHSNRAALHYVSGCGEEAAEREAAERRNPAGITLIGRRQRLLTQHVTAELSLASSSLTLVQLEGGVGHGVEYLLSLQYVDVPQAQREGERGLWCETHSGGRSVMSDE